MTLSFGITETAMTDAIQSLLTLIFKPDSNSTVAVYSKAVTFSKLSASTFVIATSP